MSLVEHAKRELALAGWATDDEFASMMRDDVLAMIELFASQGHSGMSAGVAIRLITALMEYEPLTPLTGEDSEWKHVGENNGAVMYQNIRCSKVFKDVKEGEPDRVCLIDHYVFTDDGGETAYTSSRSTLTGITFPFTVPKKVYLPYDDHEFARRQAAGIPLIDKEN